MKPGQHLQDSSVTVLYPILYLGLKKVRYLARRGEEEKERDSLEKQPQHQAIEQGHSPVGCGRSGHMRSLAETLVLHLQTMAHLLQELLLHHSSLQHYKGVLDEYFLTWDTVVIQNCTSRCIAAVPGLIGGHCDRCHTVWQLLREEPSAEHKMELISKALQAHITSKREVDCL